MADRLPIDGKIAQANGRLKAGRIRCKIERLGNRLRLRATLPPKPGSSKTAPFQQRIALGYSANAAGLSLAEAEAKQVAGLLDAGRFSWRPYLPQEMQTETVSDWIDRFEKDYFMRRSRSAKSELTYRDYATAFKKLPAEAVLTAAILVQAVEGTAPDTKTRKRCCMAYGALARLAGLEVNLKPYRGCYSPSAVEPRQLPDDETIARWFKKIPNKGWQQCYALLATYGIRPSELWALDFSNLPVLGVLATTKTGARQVWPYHPEWLEWVHMGTIALPKVSGAHAGETGHRATVQFRRYNIPFSPKMLRHAWAVRTMAYGLATSEAARQMGHSEAVHCQIYHRWLDERHHQATFERAISNPERPRPPVITEGE